MKIIASVGCAFIIWLAGVQAQESINMLTATQQQVTQSRGNNIHNPHWQTEGCSACHRGPASRQKLNLHTKDINALCNSCHETISEHSYIHPYGMVPSKTVAQRMPAEFKQALKRSGGNLSCITCHDLTMTCLPEKKAKRGLNPRFFRDGPYKTRTELCYRCHDASKYQRLNPHDQIDDKGELNLELCSVCHVTLDKLKSANSIEDVDFNYEGNLSDMCAGCHPVKPHPGGSFSFFSNKEGPNHLVKPPEKILLHKRKMEQLNNVVLPLDPKTGKVFCGTCHNPHEKGVIKVEAAAKGADSHKRLRMQSLCSNCHDK